MILGVRQKCNQNTRTKLIINQELSLRTKIRSLDTQTNLFFLGRIWERTVVWWGIPHYIAVDFSHFLTFSMLSMLYSITVNPVDFNGPYHTLVGL